MGGVGGAVLLGGIALVLWRLFGRKKHGGEDEGLIGKQDVATKGSLREKRISSNTVPNFDMYNRPMGNVNTALNF